MGWFRRKTDPIAESERRLNEQIAGLESEIRNLNQRLGEVSDRKRPGPGGAPAARPGPAASGPTFEDLNPQRIPAEPASTPAHFNELGVRKYDPVASVRRWLAQLKGGPTANPKLVNYLAAGSIHGLRPLRYEKRIARNRFLALCALFLAVLWGLVYIYLKNR